MDNNDKPLADSDQTPDPLDERWFVVDDETWDDLNHRLDEPAKVLPRLKDDLLERSSFGTPEAQEARASMSDEKVARVLRGLSNRPADGGES